jgi:hypothetical protein
MNAAVMSGLKRSYLLGTMWMLGVGVFLCASPSQADEADPASRVARLGYLLGNVYVNSADEQAATPASINQPLTIGDELRTDPRARVELQLGTVNLQVDENAQLQLLELSDNVLQVNVVNGTVNLRVRRLDPDERIEIDTPNAAISVREPGSYRVDVTDSHELTQVQVRDGSVEVSGARQHFSLHANEQLRLTGSKHLTAEFDAMPVMDEFDRWAAQRNQRTERVASARYVSADVIGYEDLDEYGDWQWDSDYGYVWIPTRVSSGWVPYRHGRWRWVGPWGWTWIDEAPWGFAPFHYGRWTTLRNRWCWVPGPRSARPVYAPALVAWLGTSGASVSVRYGNQPISWLPLGPREIYRPAYRSSHDYVVSVNFGNSRFDHDEFERGLRRQPHEDHYGNRSATSVVSAEVMRGAGAVDHQLIKQPGVHLGTVDQAPFSQPEHGASSWRGYNQQQNLGRDHVDQSRRDDNFNEPVPMIRQRSNVGSPYIRPEHVRPEANEPRVQPRLNVPDTTPRVERPQPEQRQRGNQRDTGERRSDRRDVVDAPHMTRQQPMPITPAPDNPQSPRPQSGGDNSGAQRQGMQQGDRR